MAERKRTRGGREVATRYPSRYGESTETLDPSTQLTRTTTLSPEDAPGLRLVAPGPVVGLRVIGTERELHLPSGQRSFTLGTSAACDLVISREVSKKVSGLHATLGRLADGRVVIADQQSKNGIRTTDGAPRVAAFEVTAGQRFLVADVALLAVDEALQQLRRPVAWTFGLTATAAVDGALEVISRGRPLALVGPPGTDALALARHIHAASAHRQHFCLELTEAGSVPPLEHAVGGTVIVDLDGVGRATRRVVEAVVDRPSARRRRGLRGIFLASSWSRLASVLDVLRAEVDELAVPALATRAAEVPTLLAHVWLHELGTRRRVEELGPAALEALTAASWPQNFDSLREAARRLLAVVEHETLAAAAAALGIKRQSLAGSLARLGVSVGR